LSRLRKYLKKPESKKKILEEIEKHFEDKKAIRKINFQESRIVRNAMLQNWLAKTCKEIPNHFLLEKQDRFSMPFPPLL